MRTRSIPAALFALYSAILVAVMVFKEIPTIRVGHLILRFGGADANGRANFVPFKTIMLYWHSGNGLIANANLIGNIALLVPIGFLAPLVWAKMRWYYALLLAVASGLVIEGLQVLFHVGIFDIDDVLLNALGVMLGYVVFAMLYGDKGFLKLL